MATATVKNLDVGLQRTATRIKSEFVRCHASSLHVVITSNTVVKEYSPCIVVIPSHEVTVVCTPTGEVPVSGTCCYDKTLFVTPEAWCLRGTVCGYLDWWDRGCVGTPFFVDQTALQETKAMVSREKYRVEKAKKKMIDLRCLHRAHSLLPVENPPGMQLVNMLPSVNKPVTYKYMVRAPKAIMGIYPRIRTVPVTVDTEQQLVLVCLPLAAHVDLVKETFHRGTWYNHTIDITAALIKYPSIKTGEQQSTLIATLMREMNKQLVAMLTQTL